MDANRVIKSNKAGRVSPWAHPVHSVSNLTGSFSGDNMRRIDISTTNYPDTFTLVSDEDFEWLNRWKWHFHSGYAIRTKYLGGGRENQKSGMIQMHRLTLNAGNGQEVDHKDGDGLNNQRKNLRIATSSQNSQNCKKRKTCSSKYKGVCWDKKNRKWRARIYLDKKEFSLGRYNSEIEAAHVYDKAAQKLFGEFAYLNFPDDAGRSA